MERQPRERIISRKLISNHGGITTYEEIFKVGLHGQPQIRQVSGGTDVGHRNIFLGRNSEFGFASASIVTPHDKAKIREAKPID